jgi:hypothetical protein
MLDVLFGPFSGTVRAVFFAKRKEITTASDSRSIAPESLHGTMLREHFSGEFSTDFPKPNGH